MMFFNDNQHPEERQQRTCLNCGNVLSPGETMGVHLVLCHAMSIVQAPSITETETHFTCPCGVENLKVAGFSYFPATTDLKEPSYRCMADDCDFGGFNKITAYPLEQVVGLTTCPECENIITDEMSGNCHTCNARDFQ